MQETVRGYYDNAFACRREVGEEETLFFTSYVALEKSMWGKIKRVCEKG